MNRAFTLLEQRLKQECRQRPVYYLPNPGNLGDALIRYGTLKFFRDIGLEFRELRPRRKDWYLPVLKGGTVIYGGGGGWTPFWSHSEHYLKRLRRRFKVIVLPSTFGRAYRLPGVPLFSRDLCESLQNMPGSDFCHDMAFYIGDEFSGGETGSGSGYFFRTDPESAHRIPIPENNNDISLKGNHLSDITTFFDEIRKYSVVHTDRLHVSIAACLLHREVHLYPGSYFKNRAVYLSSMKDYYENVHFHQVPGFAEAPVELPSPEERDIISER